MGVPYGEVIERMKLCGKLKNDSAIARVLGISPQAISNYKKRNDVPANLILKFADIYGAFIDWLLTGQGPIYKKATINNELYPKQNKIFLSSELNNSEEIIYSSKLLKILRQGDEHLIIAMKHTIDTFFQSSEMTKENNEILDKGKCEYDCAKKEITGS